MFRKLKRNINNESDILCGTGVGRNFDLEGPRAQPGEGLKGLKPLP